MSLLEPVKVWVYLINDEDGGWPMLFSSRENALRYAEEGGKAPLAWDVSEYNPEYQEAMNDHGVRLTVFSAILDEELEVVPQESENAQ